MGAATTRRTAARHFDGSSITAEYRGRSKWHRPKARAVINKKMAMAAASLYSTGDVVAIKARTK